MKRTDLIRSVQVQFNKMDAGNAAEIVESVFEFLKDSVANGDRVELRGLGVFQPRMHMTKMGFNPKTGKHIPITANRTVKFRPSAQLLREMNA